MELATRSLPTCCTEDEAHKHKKKKSKKKKHKKDSKDKDAKLLKEAKKFLKQRTCAKLCLTIAPLTSRTSRRRALVVLMQALNRSFVAWAATNSVACKTLAKTSACAVMVLAAPVDLAGQQLSYALPCACDSSQAE